MIRPKEKDFRNVVGVMDHQAYQQELNRYIEFLETPARIRPGIRSHYKSVPSVDVDVENPFTISLLKNGMPVGRLYLLVQGLTYSISSGLGRVQLAVSKIKKQPGTDQLIRIEL